MKKYIWSLVLSIISGAFLIPISHDNTGFSFVFLIPIILFMIIPSLILKLDARRIFSGTKFWDILIWPAWFIILYVYSKVAYSNFYAGDSTLYTNIINFNAAVTWLLLIVPIIQFVYLLITNKDVFKTKLL